MEPEQERRGGKKKRGGERRSEGGGKGEKKGGVNIISGLPIFPRFDFEVFIRFLFFFLQLRL